VRPNDRRSALRLPLRSSPTRSPSRTTTDSGSDTSPAPPVVTRLDNATLARTCWPMHLYAVLGNEVGRAVEAGVLTPSEAELLVARLTVVIDQAIGVIDD
jgi:hypothetical protein